MHRALNIQEILHQIFQNFLPDSYVDALSYASHGPFDLPDEYGQSTILNLALTCRAFKDPALDALWWAMDDLTPLLALLKGFKVIEDGSGTKVILVAGFTKITNEVDPRSRSSGGLYQPRSATPWRRIQEESSFSTSTTITIFRSHP